MILQLAPFAPVFAPAEAFLTLEMEIVFSLRHLSSSLEQRVS